MRLGNDGVNNFGSTIARRPFWQQRDFALSPPRNDTETTIEILRMTAQRQDCDEGGMHRQIRVNLASLGGRYAGLIWMFSRRLSY